MKTPGRAVLPAGWREVNTGRDSRGADVTIADRCCISLLSAIGAGRRRRGGWGVRRGGAAASVRCWRWWRWPCWRCRCRWPCWRCWRARPRPGAALTFVRAPPAPRAWYFSTRRRAGAAGPRDGRAPAAALTSPPAPSQARRSRRQGQKSGRAPTPAPPA